MRRTTVAACLALCAFLVPSARADFPEGIPDKFRFGIGGMISQMSTQGAVGSSQYGVGTFLDLEDVFDLPIEKQTGVVFFSWNVGGRHSIDLGYTVMNRSAAHVLEEDVEFGNYVFQQGAQITASWDSTFPYAAYRYDFLRHDDVKIGGTAGVSYLDLSFGLSGSGSITTPDGTPVTESVNEEGSVGFPVPLVGLQVDWAFAKRWTFQMFVRTLRIGTNDFKGKHSMYGMHVDWWPTKHFGVGAGFDDIKLDIEKFTSDELSGQFLYDIEGLSLYLKGTF